MTGRPRDFNCRGFVPAVYPQELARIHDGDAAKLPRRQQMPISSTTTCSTFPPHRRKRLGDIPGYFCLTAFRHARPAMKQKIMLAGLPLRRTGQIETLIV
jgi:hypothetical protein